MKKAKKVVALALCAVMLVVGSVAGTMAYLQDKDEVVNTFTVGNVNIKLDEAKVDLYGDPMRYEETAKDYVYVTNVADATRVTANEYKLIPGQEYVKDPTVTVYAGSEKSYVRMLVTITDYADVKAVLGTDFLPQYFVEGWNNAVWETTKVVAVAGEGANQTATYEFRYIGPKATDGIVDARNAAIKLEPLFTHINMPGNGIDATDLENIKDMQIQVVAQAIQSDNFENADKAWEKFNNTQNPVANN